MQYNYFFPNGVSILDDRSEFQVEGKDRLEDGVVGEMTSGSGSGGGGVGEMTGGGVGGDSGNVDLNATSQSLKEFSMQPDLQAVRRCNRPPPNFKLHMSFLPTAQYFQPKAVLFSGINTFFLPYSINEAHDIKDFCYIIKTTNQQKIKHRFVGCLDSFFFCESHWGLTVESEVLEVSSGLPGGI